MKILSIAGAAALVAFGLAAQASADTFTFSPTGAITASGPTTLTATVGGKPTTISCTSTFKGSVATGGATGTITSATFSGSNIDCAAVKAANLPWTVTPTSATTVSIGNPEVTVSLVGITCGPSALTNQTLSSGVLSLSGTLNPGSCTVSGSLTTDPTVTIIDTP